MKKLMTFLLFGVLLFGELLGQSKSSQHFRINGSSNCHYSTLKTDAVIYYEKSVVVHLEFNADQPGKIWKSEKGMNDFHEIQLTNNVAHLEFPVENKTYEFYGENSCGQQYLLLEVNAQSRQKTGIIGVSKELYEAFGKYLQSGIIPMQDQFYDYIKSLENLSYWERLSFIQQYFLKDIRLETQKQGVWPSIEKAGRVRDDCNCEFVHKKTRSINPGIIVGDEVIPSMDSIFAPQAYNNKSGYAWWRKNKGPAKAHYLTSGGRNAGGTYREETFNMLIGEDFDVTIDDASPHMAELSYMLACTKEREDVKCDCTKRIIFDYAYETTLTARTKLRGGGIANKRAIAMTQDIAVATLRTDEGIRVLAAGDAREDAACNKERDPNFYSNIGEVAITLGSIILNDSVIFPLSSGDLALINTLKEELSTVFSTSYWVQNSCEGNADAVPTQLIRDTFEIVYFSPNEKVVFRLNSFSNQLVGGKRGWLSNSDITSDFYITAIVKGNVWEGDLACCTTELGIWLLASCDGVNAESPQPPPSTTASLQARVGAILGLNGVWPDLETVGGGFDNLLITTELGVTVGKIGRCGLDTVPYKPTRKIKDEDFQVITPSEIKFYVEQIEDNNQHKAIHQEDEVTFPDLTPTKQPSPYTFMEVYSINGQPVYRGDFNSESSLNLSQIIMERNLTGHNGIYVIRLSNDQGDWEVRKLIIVQ